jgi:hypothetical protein
MQTLIRIFFAGILLYGCGPATQITGSWKNSKVKTINAERILVAALTGNTNARQTVENDLTAALQENGYKAIKSMDILPPTFTASKEPDKEVILEKISGTGVDAILTIALINKETENRYVPGSYGYEPIARFGYFGGFWGYYNTWYPTLYASDYYTEGQVYFIETNLYDAKSEELLWSAQSETYNPGGLAGFSNDFAIAVFDKMRDDGVIKKD